MLRKRRVSGYNFLDKLHRGAVYVCMGVTVAGSSILVARLWNYYMYEKPERKRLQLKMQEEQALANKEKQLTG